MARLAFRRGALALALFALGGQAFGVAHLWLVPHAVCAAHGELIHLDGASASPARAAHDATRDAYQSDAEAEHGASDAHEHCAVSAVRRVHVVIASAQPIDLQHARICETTFDDREAAACRGVAILLLAPKSSPPSARA